jgi:hypothetical protein
MTAGGRRSSASPAESDPGAQSTSLRPVNASA